MDIKLMNRKLKKLSSLDEDIKGPLSVIWVYS